MTMANFLEENFLLTSPTAQRLYHDYAQHLPIIDYHCHLPPDQMARDQRFENLTQVWLYGDHYKWRAMRARGVDESYCTGDKPDWEKFEQWAATVPYAVRNPLYHWTHLELRRYFSIRELLEPRTAKRIYDSSSSKLLSEEYSVRGLLRRMNVQLVCTTDDPCDSLEFHEQLVADEFDIRVLPAFRPDMAMSPEDPSIFSNYLRRLESATNLSISSYQDYLDALKRRHDYFAAHGCSVSDHGLETMYAEDYGDSEVRTIFQKIRGGRLLEDVEVRKFKSAMLAQFAEWDFEKSWVQQFHLGAIRNNNSRLALTLGKDTGWDSIGDFPQARSLAKFLDRMDAQNKLTRTILYNLNPMDNEVMATMTGNFNDGSIAGKIQWGSAWWFLDQKDGIVKHLNALSNMGLLSQFIGMITDSRSFLSFPRHEYFRRILCNLFGSEVEAGELPSDLEWLGQLIADICYFNAKRYFNWSLPEKSPGAGSQMKDKTRE